LRNFFTQSHSTIVRDLILNEDLDREDVKMIDFTWGTGSMWKTDWKYKFQGIRCDAKPTEDRVIKKDLLTDDYSEFFPCDAGWYDPPYLIGRHKQAFDHNSKVEGNGTLSVIPASLQGPRSWAHEGQIDRFTGNLNEQEFIDRVKGLNRAAAQCIKPEGLLFVKVMDTRKNEFLFPAHIICYQELTNFRLYANCGYISIGSRTWRTKYEGSFGYWMVYRRRKERK
jgi:hypothetical protein